MKKTQGIGVKVQDLPDRNATKVTIYAAGIKTKDHQLLEYPKKLTNFGIHIMRTVEHSYAIMAHIGIAMIPAVLAVINGKALVIFDSEDTADKSDIFMDFWRANAKIVSLKDIADLEDLLSAIPFIQRIRQVKPNGKIRSSEKIGRTPGQPQTSGLRKGRVSGAEAQRGCCDGQKRNKKGQFCKGR